MSTGSFMPAWLSNFGSSLGQGIQQNPSLWMNVAANTMRGLGVSPLITAPLSAGAGGMAAYGGVKGQQDYDAAMRAQTNQPFQVPGSDMPGGSLDELMTGGKAMTPQQQSIIKKGPPDQEKIANQVNTSTGAMGSDYAAARLRQQQAMQQQMQASRIPPPPVAQAYKGFQTQPLVRPTNAGIPGSAAAGAGGAGQQSGGLAMLAKLLVGKGHTGSFASPFGPSFA